MGYSKTEFDKINEILAWQLPNGFKKVGIISAALLMSFLVYCKFAGIDNIILKEACKFLILLSLLATTLSSDKIEDEYVRQKRAQAFSSAFVAAVMYAILMPLISLGLDLLISQVDTDNKVNFYDMSAFEVLFNLLCFQILFFFMYKKLGCAE